MGILLLLSTERGEKMEKQNTKKTVGVQYDEKPTIIYKYDVIGKICPHGMTAGNCHLRKILNEWQTKYGFGGSRFGFGYKILENGNLLVPYQFAMGNEPGDLLFDLKKTIEETCNGSCYRENREKAKQNPEEFQKQPEMQTVIYAYTEEGINFCPSKCQLCKTLEKLEKKHAIGYKQLGEKTLLVPREHYDSKNNIYRNISKMETEICDKCREKNR